jgi:hypothetical protein
VIHGLLLAATDLVGKWGTIVIVCCLAVWCFYQMLNINEQTQRQEDLIVGSPRFMQIFYTVTTWGLWRNRTFMRAWSFMVWLLCFLFCLGLVIALLFLAR